MSPGYSGYYVRRLWTLLKASILAGTSCVSAEHTGHGPRAILVFRALEELSSTRHLGSGLISAGITYGDRKYVLGPGTARVGMERELWASVGGKLFSKLRAAGEAPAWSLLGPSVGEEGTL